MANKARETSGNTPIKPRHSVYYKSYKEKEIIEQLAEKEDLSASKFIYKILKEKGYFNEIS